MIGILLSLLVPSSAIVVNAQASAPLAMQPVSNVELAMMRGGLRLPNGLDLSLGFDIQTRIDGQLALHTVYASDGANPGIRVYTDGEKPVPLAPTTATIVAGTVQGIPTLIVDRSPSGTTILPARAVGATTVNLVNGDPSTWLSGVGQVEIPVAPNGPAVAAAPGDVRLTTGSAGAIVTLSTPTLELQQLVGQATGVVVANTADNRVINTVSSVNVDLRGLSSSLIASTSPRNARHSKPCCCADTEG